MTNNKFQAADSILLTQVTKNGQKKQMWTAGPEVMEWTTNEVFCGSGRFMFVRMV